MNSFFEKLIIIVVFSSLTSFLTRSFVSWSLETVICGFAMYVCKNFYLKFWLLYIKQSKSTICSTPKHFYFTLFTKSNFTIKLIQLFLNCH